MMAAPSGIASINPCHESAISSKKMASPFT
jgi:hypothetical protein